MEKITKQDRIDSIAWEFKNYWTWHNSWTSPESEKIYNRLKNETLTADEITKILGNRVTNILLECMICDEDCDEVILLEEVYDQKNEMEVSKYICEKCLLKGLELIKEEK